MKKINYKTDQNHPQIRAYREAVEKGKLNQHVLPHDGEWVVKKAFAEKPTKVFKTQKEATSFAQSVAKNQGTTAIVHGRDGRIRSRKDY